jgi:hypothetical protein
MESLERKSHAVVGVFWVRVPKGKVTLLMPDDGAGANGNPHIFDESLCSSFENDFDFFSTLFKN